MSGMDIEELEAQVLNQSEWDERMKTAAENEREMIVGIKCSSNTSPLDLNGFTYNANDNFDMYYEVNNDSPRVKNDKKNDNYITYLDPIRNVISKVGAGAVGKAIGFHKGDKIVGSAVMVGENEGDIKQYFNNYFNNNEVFNMNQATDINKSTNNPFPPPALSPEYDALPPLPPLPSPRAEFPNLHIHAIKKSQGHGATYLNKPGSTGPSGTTDAAEFKYTKPKGSENELKALAMTSPWDNNYYLNIANSYLTISEAGSLAGGDKVWPVAERILIFFVKRARGKIKATLNNPANEEEEKEDEDDDKEKDDAAVGSADDTTGKKKKNDAAAGSADDTTGKKKKNDNRKFCLTTEVLAADALLKTDCGSAEEELEKATKYVAKLKRMGARLANIPKPSDEEAERMDNLVAAKRDEPNLGLRKIQAKARANIASDEGGNKGGGKRSRKRLRKKRKVTKKKRRRSRKTKKKQKKCRPKKRAYTRKR